MSSQWLQILVAAFLFSVGHGKGIEERIYGGKDAKAGQFPYHALIAKYYQDVNATFCNGALIAPNWILTAASCVKRGPPMTIFLGAVNLYDPSDEYDIVDKASFIMHEKYNPKTHENDIGLLKLPTQAKMSDKVKTIDIPPISWTKIKNNNVDKFDNAAVYVTGFGKKDGANSDFPVATRLQYTDLSIAQHNICAEKMKEFYEINESNGIMCVRTPRKGPCSQDEGAPLRLVNTTDSKYLLGLFSWNIGACASYDPAIFTYVGNYIQWIQSKIGS